MSSVIFWVAWIVIPLIMEVIPTVGNFIILLKRRIMKKKYKPLSHYPNESLSIFSGLTSVSYRTRLPPDFLCSVSH
jgi:hypothetical protein